jgi:hypothetical protein
MLARVLSRVPDPDQTYLLCAAVFVMPSRSCADYLSAKYLEGRGLVILGEELLELPEDKQVAIILPLAAHCLLRSRHPAENPLADRPLPDPIDKDTGEWQDGKMMEYVKENLKLLPDAKVDLQIDVHFAKRKAEEMVQTWLTRWKESTRR